MALLLRLAGRHDPARSGSPGLDQIVDECSPEIRPFGTPEFLISSLRNWASTVAVWGLALDPQGGPIQAGNNCPGCRGVVTINPQTQTVTFPAKYYQLGQVSAFVQPGATRIDSPSFVTYGVNSSNIETVSPGLDDVAFLNPDGSKALIAYNNSTAPISFAVQSNGRYFSYTIPASGDDDVHLGRPDRRSAAPRPRSPASRSRAARWPRMHGDWSNSPTAYGYQWVRCDRAGNGCAPIPGADGQTYSLVPTDVGGTIRVQRRRATPSAQAARWCQRPPRSCCRSYRRAAGPPAIAGVAQQGQTLLEAHGDWSNGPAGYRYQWVRCDPRGNGCAPLAGANRQTYTWPGATSDERCASGRRRSTPPARGRVSSAHTEVVLPSPATLRAVLVKALAPAPRSTTIAALLTAGGYPVSIDAPTPGRVDNLLVYVQPGARLTTGHATPSAILVGRGSARFSRPGLIRFTVRLTRQVGMCSGPRRR